MSLIKLAADANIVKMITSGKLKIPLEGARRAIAKSSKWDETARAIAGHYAPKVKRLEATVTKLKGSLKEQGSAHTVTRKQRDELLASLGESKSYNSDLMKSLTEMGQRNQASRSQGANAVIKSRRAAAKRIAALHAAHANEISGLKGTHTNELSRLTSEHENAISGLKGNHAANVHKLNRNWAIGTGAATLGAAVSELVHKKKKTA